jgi:hypothetical protein
MDPLMLRSLRNPRHEFGIGRYVITEDENAYDWWGYWHAYLGENRVNGGVCDDYTEGAERAMRAIAQAREMLVLEKYYWDSETCLWIKKGELPPV